MLFWLRWDRLGTKNTVLVVDGCRVLVEDGAVGWSCKCSSGRHCRRIGGHRSRDRARASCSLSRGHNLRLASPGARIQAARGLEFCVLGIVVHLRLGNCIGYSLREGCSGDSCICHTLALNRSCVQSLLASMCGPKACSLCVLPLLRPVIALNAVFTQLAKAHITRLQSS